MNDESPPGRKASDDSEESHNAARSTPAFSLADKRVDCNVPEISWNHLVSPQDKDGNDTTIHLGCGVFGSCQKKYYKGIPVAVKVFKDLSSSQDVKHESAIMARCVHPSIPHIFGLNVT